MDVFSFVQWNKYFHSAEDECTIRLVEWNISSYLYHCTHKHSLFAYFCITNGLNSLNYYKLINMIKDKSTHLSCASTFLFNR